jgi:hypothetical protein
MFQLPSKSEVFYFDQLQLEHQVLALNRCQLISMHQRYNGSSFQNLAVMGN